MNCISKWYTKCFKSKLFLKAFGRYLFLFSLLCIVFFSVLYFIMQGENTKKLIRGYNENANRMAILMDEYFSAAVQISDYLTNSSWVYKLTSETKVMTEEFDYARKKELAHQLAYLTADRGNVTHVAVVYPYMQFVVTSSGWFSYEDYVSYMQRKYTINEADLYKLTFQTDQRPNTYQSSFNYHNQDYLMQFRSLEGIHNPRAIAVTVIENKQVQRYLGSIAEPSLEQISIRLNEETLFEYGAKSNKNYQVQKSSFMSDISYTLSYTLGGGSFEWMIVSAIFSLLIGIYLSFILARQDYKPMRQLVEQIATTYDDEGMKQESIEREYDYIKELLSFMHENNQNLQNKVDIYYQAARNNLLLQLLRGYFRTDNMMQQLNQFGVAYQENSKYTVFLVVFKPTTKDIVDGHREAIYVTCESILDDIGSFDVVTFPDAQFAIVFSPTQKGAQNLDAQAEVIADSLTQNIGSQVQIIVGGYYQGIIGISKSYQNAKLICEGTVQINSESTFYFPLDWEIQLVQHLKQGEEQNVFHILKELRVENKLRSKNLTNEDALLKKLIEIFQRVTQNYPSNSMIEVTKFIHSKSIYTWEDMLKIGEGICNAVTVQNSARISDTKREVLAYVNERYCESDISLKSLGEYYNISVVSASRIFKEACGQNFYDYLTMLRMDKAKKLLLTLGYDLNYITKAVGYENEYSFRRAFLRYTGMKPRAFIEYNTKANES
ncbi:MAG: helix-turn-helix domain-containing protein [Oscillospiraceae bacterium]